HRTGLRGFLGLCAFAACLRGAVVEAELRPEGAGARCDAAAARADAAGYLLSVESQGVWSGLNPAHALRLVSSPEGVRIQSPQDDPGPPWSWGLPLVRHGSPGAVRSEPPSLPIVSGSRIDLGHAGGGEWYFNSRKGVQHGLDLGASGGAGGHEWIE